MYGWSISGGNMKNMIRYLFGRFYSVECSELLSYKGSWSKGLFHGYGVLKHNDKSTYQGNFKFGSKHGYGEISSTSGFMYSGEWKNGRQTGSAKIFYKNGDWYQGFVKNGIRNGFGVFHEKSSQRTFKGYWTRGVLSGKVQITSNEWKYSGTFPDRYGRASGNLAYSDGSAYAGDVTNFTRHGDGQFLSSSGNLIEGRWVDDMNVDHATTTDSEGIQWYGTLKNLKPQGFMKVQLPNGQKYDGVWLNGKLQRALSVRNKRDAEPVYHFY